MYAKSEQIRAGVVVELKPFFDTQPEQIYPTELLLKTIVLLVLCVEMRF